MDLGLDGKRAAVAAASAGLGLASARALAAEGANVAICGRDRRRIETAARDVGHGCVPLVVDVSDAAGGAAFVAAATEALGGVDILVANSGGPPPGTFASTDIEAYPAAIDLSLMSVVAMVKSAAPAMVASGWGRIVAITSIAVRQPIGHLILSNTARAGVTGFLKTVALELQTTGVTVNSVQPGPHGTDRVKQLYGAEAERMRLGEPADFGSIVTFLCGEQAKFITGAQVHVDGGSYVALQ